MSSIFSSKLDLLGNAERIIDLDAEIADRAFKLRVFMLAATWAICASEWVLEFFAYGISRSMGHRST